MHFEPRFFSPNLSQFSLCFLLTSLKSSRKFDEKRRKEKKRILRHEELRSITNMVLVSQFQQFVTHDEVWGNLGYTDLLFK